MVEKKRVYFLVLVAYTFSIVGIVGGFSLFDWAFGLKLPYSLILLRILLAIIIINVLTTLNFMFEPYDSEEITHKIVLGRRKK